MCQWCVVQPFPRIEFGAEHAEMSLRDLHLVPSGSLVVKLVPAVLPSGHVLLNLIIFTPVGHVKLLAVRWWITPEIGVFIVTRCICKFWDLVIFLELVKVDISNLVCILHYITLQTVYCGHDVFVVIWEITNRLDKLSRCITLCWLYFDTLLSSITALIPQSPLPSCKDVTTPIHILALYV